MTETFQITTNEVISAICKAIYDAYTEIENDLPVTSINIYKEEQQELELPAVTIYCSNYETVTERFDRFTNNFDIIINYFPTDEYIMNNNGRQKMFFEAQKIIGAINYINLPAYKLDNDILTPIKLPCRKQNCNISEKDGFIQISVRYVVRTKQYNKQVKMNNLDLNINENS